MQLKLVVVLTAFLALAVLGAVEAAETVPEPADYRTENYRAPVPSTLRGAQVIDTDQAELLAKKDDVIFIDVYPQAPKPPNLPKSTVWRAPKHETMKGAYWLPNVGYGVLNPTFTAYFKDQLTKLTGGDKKKPLVFFCLRDCWMSWNAAKRALEWGHEHVLWFPDGTDGWREWNLPTQMKTPEQ